jgi:NAD(P)H-hydrate repair Nnr-like enzyme with NAD(P)H-hydrate epimerase domain
MDHGFLSEADLDPTELASIVDRTTAAETVPLAADIVSGVPVYDGARVDFSFTVSAELVLVVSECAYVLAD